MATVVVPVYNRQMFMHWIDERMHDRELTERMLADRLGVTQQAVSRWRNGLARPSGLRIGKLAIALEVPVDQVIAALEQDAESMTLEIQPKQDRSLEAQVRDLTERLEVVERALVEQQRRPAKRVRTQK